MGTNFYLVPDEEGPLTRRLHIGKRSGGHPFNYHSIPELGLTSRLAWVEFLADNMENASILDEYSTPHPLDGFIRECGALDTYVTFMEGEFF